MGSPSSPSPEGGASASLAPSSKLTGSEWPEWPVLVLGAGNCEAPPPALGGGLWPRWRTRGAVPRLCPVALTLLTGGDSQGVFLFLHVSLRLATPQILQSTGRDGCLQNLNLQLSETLLFS